ncbi:MAG TPA: gamma-glutamyltransferase [Pyrinomonadaceae bacterium]|nr:gamma-glutamyltransferase [Pyrinomonadaceae bacterium]
MTANCFRMGASLFGVVILISAMLVTNLPISAQNQSTTRAGRSVVRAQHGMVASSQPLASAVGLEILKSGGNAVDAAIAMAAMLNVTEPMMTGIGGDMFAMVYWAKTKELNGLNASGRAPRAMTIDYFKQKNVTRMPQAGMDTITVPGAFDGWVTLHEKYGTKKFADLLSPAIDYAENGFPVMEKTAEDWAAEVDKLKRNKAANESYLVNGRPPAAGEIFRERNLAKTLRTLARGGRDAFYKGSVGQAIADYCKQNGCLITMDDLAAQKSEWVQPISTSYHGYKVCEMPPNGQGLTALIALNILEGLDLASQSPARYYHSLIEATKLAFADRNTYIADPAFAKVPVTELLSKDYAAKRRALIDPEKALDNPPAGVNLGSDTTYFTVVDKDGNAVSFINSLFDLFGSGVVAGDTGIVLQNRGNGFSLDPNHLNRLEPGKRPFHTLIPAMVFKDDKLFLSFGVMGGAIQAQGHVQVLSSLIDRKLGLQEAIDAPRYRFTERKSVLLEDELGSSIIDSLIRKGHVRATPPGTMRSSMGGGQAIMIDPTNGTLMGASDHRKDGLALGY